MPTAVVKHEYFEIENYPQNLDGAGHKKRLMKEQDKTHISFTGQSPGAPDIKCMPTNMKAEKLVTFGMT